MKYPTQFRRRKKPQVLAALRTHGEWRGFLCASRMYPRPGHPMNMAMPVVFTASEWDKEMVKQRIDAVLNAFEVYNCSAETGRYVHYYEVWEDEAELMNDRWPDAVNLMADANTI